MAPLQWQYNDGGRAAAGYRGETGDCVTRALAIAGSLDYRQVYDTFHFQMKANPHLVSKGRTSPRNGVPRPLYKWLLEHQLGWAWTPTMGIGTGCRVHLAAGEVPMPGRLIARLSGHLAAVVDGVVLDAYDPTRDGTRCVYGYWTAPEATAELHHLTCCDDVTALCGTDVSGQADCSAGGCSGSPCAPCVLAQARGARCAPGCIREGAA